MVQRIDPLAELLVEREGRLRAERATLESLWQDIARYLVPRKATFTEEVSPGAQRTRNVLDSTGPRALEMFASFLHTLLNNPAVQWFKTCDFDTAPDDPNDDVSVQKWFDLVDQRMMRRMADEKVNVYAHLHEGYLDIGAFGTSVTFIDWPDTLRIRAYHLADCVIDEDVYGFVDTVLRRSYLRSRQAEQRFPGIDLGSTVEKRKGDGTPTKFLHCVFPAAETEYLQYLDHRVRARISAGDEYVSVWVNAEDKVVVEQSTYEDFPYSVPRWYRTRDDIYGRSPAMTVMPDVRMANRMMETILRGAEKLVDPPLLVPDGGLLSPVRLFPGGLTMADSSGVELKPLIPPGASRIEVGDGLLKDRQAAIRDGFFVPLFATPQGPVKTATQVLQETDDRNRAVSPMLVRMQHEQFHRMLTRVFRLMYRHGEFPEPPAALHGKRVDVRYVSPLSASQHQMEALGAMRITDAGAAWASIDPSALDIFDPHEVMKVIFQGSGAPARILRTPAAVRQVTAMRNKANAAQQQQSELIPAVEAGAKVVTAQAAATRANKA